MTENLDILDQNDDFNLAEDVRPAGEWMEGYWRQIGKWSLHFAYAGFVYYSLFVLKSAFLLYNQIQFLRLNHPEISISQNLLLALIEVVFEAVYLLLAYFLFRAGRAIQMAFLRKEQALLEKGLLQVKYFFITLTFVFLFHFVGRSFSNYIYWTQYEQSNIIFEDSRLQSE